MVNQIEKVSAHLPVKNKVSAHSIWLWYEYHSLQSCMIFLKNDQVIFFFMIGNQVIFNQDQMVNHVESTKWLIK